MKRAEIILAVLLAGCGKDVVLDQSAKSFECSQGTPRSWKFSQPAETFSKIDLLFVVDTSGSMWGEFAKIRDQILSYVDALPAGADLHIALAAGHGPLSPYSGELISASGNPNVLSTLGMSRKDVQDRLYENFSALPFDFTPAGGEYLFYSYLNAISGQGLQDARSAGFFRQDAALSVVFVSDENDVCFDPRKHGYSAFPDYVRSVLGAEDIGYALFCDDNGSERYPPELVLSRTEALKGAGRFSIGAIAHVVPSLVPSGIVTEDSIGHGFTELVDLAAPASRVIEITGDYGEGLDAIAKIGSGQELFTSFPLGVLSATEVGSLAVSVDGASVPFQTAIDTKGSVTISIRSENAGAHGSKVLVQACSI